MRVVDDTIETIHLYVVREEEKQPYTLLPLLGALLCLVGIAVLTLYSAQHPYYEHERLTVPAQLLPSQTFTATQPIIPTGIQTYPAIAAQGVLTITNGSVIAQTLPAGLTFISTAGTSVITDEAVFVPAGNATDFGMATVSAHAMLSGQRGNLPPYAINSVVGSSVYVRNLSAFTGGKDAYSVKFATAQDKQTALLQARGILLSKSSGLHYPCAENHIGDVTRMVLTWRCQFVKYTVPSYMHVASVQLIGNHVVVSVWYLPPVRQVRMR